MKDNSTEIVYGNGSLVWNDQHVFMIKSIDIPQPERIEAEIEGVNQTPFLLDVIHTMTLNGTASVKFTSEDIHSFELYMNNHKFKLKGYIGLSTETMLKIDYKRQIEIVY